MRVPPIHISRQQSAFHRLFVYEALHRRRVFLKVFLVGPELLVHWELENLLHLWQIYLIEVELAVCQIAVVLNLEEEVVVLVLSWLLDLNSTEKHFVSLSQSVHFQNEPLYLIQNQINFCNRHHNIIKLKRVLAKVSLRQKLFKKCRHKVIKFQSDSILGIAPRWPFNLKIARIM